jgi:hypothetical protein
MAKLNRRRFTTVLSANTNLKVRIGGATFFGSHSDKLSHTLLVENLEGIVFQDTFFEINGQEFAGIIT